MRHPTNPLMFMALGALLAACAPVAAVGQTAQSESAKPAIMMEPAADVVSQLDAARTTFAEAYVRQDAKALSALFHPDAAFAGTLHPYWMEGRDTIQRLWTYYFGTYQNAKIFFWSSSLRVISGAPAVVQYATATMAMPDGKGGTHNVHMRLSIIWVRVPDYVVGSKTLQWQIAHMHGSEAPLFR